MALQKIGRGMLNTGVSDSSDATAITIDSSENLEIESGNIRYKEDKFIYSFKGGTSGQVRSGFLFDGTNQSVDFYTAQGERMMIDSSGNVGIGITSPSVPLEVAGNIKVNASNGEGFLLNSSSTTGIFRQNSNDLGFTVGGSERWRIDSSGHFTGVSGSKIVQTIASGGGNFLEVTHSGNEAWSMAVQSGTGVDDYLDIGINGGTRAISIHEDGKVGIGRTDPTQLLEVHKSTGGDQTVAKFSAHNYGDTGKTFIEIGTEYGDGSSRIGSFNDTGNSSVLVFDTHSSTSGQFTERMRIDSSVNVKGAKGLLSGTITNMLNVIDTTSAASGVGGGIQFMGAYTGSTVTTFASIEGIKANATGGNYAGDLIIKTRNHGGNNVERLRLYSDDGGQYGRMQLTSSYGSIGVGALNAGYHHTMAISGPTIFYWNKRCEANGGFHTYSDERLKENITNISGALDKVALMNGVTFNWIDAENRGGGDTGKNFGVIAQNMLTVDPELPSLNSDPLATQEEIDDDELDTDYYTMDYSRITPFLIEAVKELKTKLEAAEARIETLEG
jgi:hypothetical protein